MYALIKNGQVKNIIEADAEFAASIAHEWDSVVAIALGDACIDWAYSNGAFVAPSATAQAPVARAPISKREFLKLFTPAEYGAIKKAAAVKTYVDYFWQQFLLADFISLDDPDIAAGLSAIEAAGLLAAGRSAEIVA